MTSKKRRIARNFSAAAPEYDHYAGLQRQVVDALLPLVPRSEDEPRVLDAGAGTGYALREGWLGLDIAEAMCRQHPGFLCADMQQMPLRSAVFDGVFSSLAMQWLDDASAFLREAYRVTTPRGWLVASTFGTGTLKELRAAFEASGLIPPLLPFHALSRLKLQLHRCGWNLVRLETETLTQNHPDVQALLHQIKRIGARHKEKPAAGLRGKNWLNDLGSHYPMMEGEGILSSWEVIRFRAEK